MRTSTLWDKGLLCHVTGQPAFRRVSQCNGVRRETVPHNE